MAHIYITFDFGTDEAKAQQARHKLDGWKQAFRLDKKLLYKFERPASEGDGAGSPAPAEKNAETSARKPAKGMKTAKAAAGAKPKAAKQKEETPEAPAAPPGPVKLHLRLAFSGHEKMSEERWLKRIPSEEPFKDAAPEALKSSDAGFAEIEGKFDALEG